MSRCLGGGGDLGQNKNKHLVLTITGNQSKYEILTSSQIMPTIFRSLSTCCIEETPNFCCWSKRLGFIDDLLLECRLPPLKELVGCFSIEQQSKVLIYLMTKHITRFIRGYFFHPLPPKWIVCAHCFDRLRHHECANESNIHIESIQVNTLITITGMYEQEW